LKTFYQPHVVALTATFNEEYAMTQAYQEGAWLTTAMAGDPLESLARLGAQRILQSALEEEVEAYLQRKRYERKEGTVGYRSGSLPERSIIWAAARCPSKYRA
jgi:hypothetical protein